MKATLETRRGGVGPSPRAGRLARGFSLIEVMVAMLVLGVGVVGVAEGISAAVRSGRESQEQTTAALYAAGLIETLRAEGYLTDGSSEGECPPALGQYRWRRTLSPTGIEGLHEVVVAVEDSRSGRRVCELQTMLFEVPSESPVRDRDRQRERESDARRKERRGGGR